jgi:hypothetical protein
VSASDSGQTLSQCRVPAAPCGYRRPFAFDAKLVDGQSDPPNDGLATSNREDVPAEAWVAGDAAGRRAAAARDKGSPHVIATGKLWRYAGISTAAQAVFLYASTGPWRRRKLGRKTFLRNACESYTVADAASTFGLSLQLQSCSRSAATCTRAADS